MLQQLIARIFAGLWIGCTLSFAQSPSEVRIFHDTVPQIVPIWHRVADYSPMLRSVEAAELSPDGRLAVSAAKFGYNVMLWRVADGTLVWENVHESEVECITFSPDGKYIASAGEDYFIRIWDASTGEEVHKWEHSIGFDGITWSHDGSLIAGGSEGGEMVLLDGTTFDFIDTLTVGSTINSLDFTQNDSLIVLGGNIQKMDPSSGEKRYTGFVKLVDLEKMEVIREYVGPKGSVKSVRISTDEQLIASSGFDSTARLFDFETGELLQTFREPKRIEAVAFTPDNQYLLTGGHQTHITFYRLKDNQNVLEIPSPRTEYLHFSADGRLLLTSHEDSGLLSLFMFLSDTQDRPGFYSRVSRMQLNNRDLQDE